LEQLAFPDEDHADSSLQDHHLRLRGEWGPRSDVRLGLVLGDELLFSGLGNFRPFQNIVGAEPFVAFDELPCTSTSLGVGLQGKKALDRDYDFYSGSRIDVLLRQRLRWRSVRGDVSYRHRRERLGSRSTSLLGDPQNPQLPRRKPGALEPASYLYMAPYSYDSDALLASVEITKGIWRFGMDGTVERLNFRGDNVVYVAGTGGKSTGRVSERPHRRDVRLGGSASVTMDVVDPLDVVLRYDIIDNRSTLVLDVDNRNFVKHVVTLTVEAAW
jgi:hypothetical protein